MRILLDAQISPKRVAAPLRARGHDVLAVDEDRELAEAPDEMVLRLATADERILVTFDVNDFPPLLREWAAASRPHAGCIMFVGLRNNEHGAVLRRLESAFSQRPSQAEWRDVALYL